MNWYDPYYLIDPTTEHDPLPLQGRSNSGRFTHNSILTGMGDSSFPIDSKLWASYARGVIARVVHDRGRPLADRIVPDQHICNLSWRMICEMFECARDAIQSGKSDDDAVQAAHAWLIQKQRETAEKLPDGTEPSPIISGGEILYPHCVSPSTSDDEFPF